MHTYTVYMGVVTLMCGEGTAVFLHEVLTHSSALTRHHVSELIIAVNPVLGTLMKRGNLCIEQV